MLRLGHQLGRAAGNFLDGFFLRVVTGQLRRGRLEQGQFLRRVKDDLRFVPPPAARAGRSLHRSTRLIRARGRPVCGGHKVPVRLAQFRQQIVALLRQRPDARLVFRLVGRRDRRGIHRRDLQLPHAIFPGPTFPKKTTAEAACNAAICFRIAASSEFNRAASAGSGAGRV